MAILVIIPIIIAAVFVASSARVIPQGQAGLLSRLGRHLKVLQPGLHIVVPVIDEVKKIRTDAKERLIENVTISDKDGRTGTISIRLTDRVVNPEKAVYAVADFEQGVATAASERLKNLIRNFSLQGLGVELKRIEADLRQELVPLLDGWGIALEALTLEGLKS